MSNRLQSEKSPYLLQHAENPVDWYSWTDEAFETAKQKDKPVFLSIGYATCHWCHVMAHESFEDREVAELMNESFVNIKVDREERPDIDNTYMTVCQLLTGQGGWPLTVIMTPDKKPFFAATYIPKETRFNRLGMMDLIPRISKAWRNERQKLLHSAEKITTGFRQTLELPQEDRPDEQVIVSARNNLGNRFDPDFGGFGSQPKFPSPHNLLFLLQYSNSFQDREAQEMACLTLEKMRLGGLYDQIGFGFHRYSTDNKWLLPHFEKMLYDQALLMIAYSDGWLNSKNEFFKQTVFEIADYISEQLTSAGGGFYSAEDADSEGEEGKFYVWTQDEIKSVLDPEEADLFVDVFNIKFDGNFHDEATGRKTGANIPYLTKKMDDLAEERGADSSRFNQQLEQIRKKLKTHRSRRIRPLLDDKILTDWNGLMIAALSHAGFIFDHPGLIASAKNAWSFISDKLVEPDQRLLHRYRDDEAAIPAMADDYAFLIWGLTELYQATFDPVYLKEALKLSSRFIDLFLDEEAGGFYMTSGDSEDLLGRQKEIYDGAIPSSNSVMAMNLLRLAKLTGQTELENKTDRLFTYFSAFLKESPAASTYAINSLITALKPSAEVVISGPSGHSLLQRLARTTVLKMKKPYIIHVITEKNKKSLAEIAPYTKHFPVDETPAAYVCHQFKCEKPVHTVEELEKVLTE